MAIHGHFYQPDRRDPFSGDVPPDPAAGPSGNWNERITADCYRPNAEVGNFGRIGWDLGPALARWLREAHPDVYASIVAQEDGNNGMALPWHHPILPLASARDRRTEIRWGLRDFELRHGHPAAGLWLPETAVDMLTLRIAAEEGVRYTILAPWQAGVDHGLDLRRPYRVELGAGHSLVVVFYDGALSGEISFDPGATVDAPRFVREAIAPRLATPLADGSPGLVLIASDGELYGHHQEFREYFLRHVTQDGAGHSRERGVEVAPLGTLLARPPASAVPIMTIRERTSWSCHHGVARWCAECADAADGRWKQPLRAGLDRLAAQIDAVCAIEAAELGVDLWAARDAYVEVAGGFVEPGEIVERALAESPAGVPRAAARLARGADAAARLGRLLAAQSSRLAMFASDAWFWDDPTRPETAQALRFAAHAVRLVDRRPGCPLERDLVADLAALRAPAGGPDGAALYRAALRQVDQPEPA